MVLSAISGLIPKIEGFAPLPNASADTFMAMQGGHMALLFGAEYTLGKRLISALSNEKFNAMVDNPQLVMDYIEPHYNRITDMFEKHLLSDVDKVQQLVMEKAFQIEILKIHQNVKLLKELPSAYWEAIWSTEDKINRSSSTSSSQADARSRQQETVSSQPKTPSPPNTGSRRTTSEPTPTKQTHKYDLETYTHTIKFHEKQGVYIKLTEIKNAWQNLYNYEISKGNSSSGSTRLQYYNTAKEIKTAIYNKFKINLESYRLNKKIWGLNPI